jgi:Fungal Zn(2)-Cys(6) binuclear cluster domain
MPPPAKKQLTSYTKSGSPASSNDVKGFQFEDDNGFAPTKGDVKPQKACVQCRRSKVKCVHDGGPPCKRCTDTKQDCKFRLRADDESWREKTEERLQNLESFYSRGVPPASQQSAPAMRPIMPTRNASAPGIYTHHHPFSPGPHPPHSSTLGPPLPSPHLLNRFTMNGLPPLNSPNSDPSHDFHSPNHDLNGSHDTASPGYHRRLLPRKRESSSFDAEQHHPSPQTPSQSSRGRHNSAQLMPPPLPPMAINADQTLPSPVLSHLMSFNSSLHIHDLSGTPRWMSGMTLSYAKATQTIGMSDPRFSVIRMGSISMEKARALFISFAEKLQPHSFGFPTYPASEVMTPVIIAAILTVSSLFEPFSRSLHDSLRKNLFSVYIKLDQEVFLGTPLDPELGIGVEEITGGCIASAWLGGEIGWKTARMTRWWAIGYLKHFEIPERNSTILEDLGMLPPFRQIDYVDKLRIFLAAYVAEAQQSFILDRPTLIPDASPMAYVDALRNAFNDLVPVSPASTNGVDTRGSMTGGSGGAQKHPPPPDRQLTGHASILHILLEAQRLQRESRWAINAAEENHLSTYGHSPNDIAVNYATVNECIDRMINIWTSWMEKTEQWRTDAANLESE